MNQTYDSRSLQPNELQPFTLICEADPKKFAIEVSGHCRFGYYFHGKMFIDHQGRYCQAMILEQYQKLAA